MNCSALRGDAPSRVGNVLRGALHLFGTHAKHRGHGVFQRGRKRDARKVPALAQTCRDGVFAGPHFAADGDDQCRRHGSGAQHINNNIYIRICICTVLRGLRRVRIYRRPCVALWKGEARLSAAPFLLYVTRSFMKLFERFNTEAVRHAFGKNDCAHLDIVFWTCGGVRGRPVAR